MRSGDFTSVGLAADCRRTTPSGFLPLLALPYGWLFALDAASVGVQRHFFNQVILPPAPGVSNEGRSSSLLGLVPPFLGPGFRLGARWNRLVETLKTRKKREKTGKKWARYGLRSVKEGT